ncbi:GntR family transcriptional regulator [Alkalihalobacterium alkalinitrilicum]|uniref:GntR family transcriptional regulator n=1 Tax=Alkalihalobacterium alkalinitrilicum TaxID=427920 RepID=UPI001154F87D|nr:GntR family transcriptional regulator [Alkalihalobacterium alkalinitrilicum]
MTGFNLKPIEKEDTTKDKIYNQVKYAILNGKIDIQDSFTEVQLAASLNTSRTPVRAALQDLVKERLIVSIPRKGFEVREITVDEQKQIFLLRAAMEAEVVKKVAPNIKDHEIDLLKSINKEQQLAIQNNNSVRFIELDQHFHLNLVRFSGMTIIEEILQNLLNLSQLIGLRAVQKQGRFYDVLKEHENIILSLKKRDPNLAYQEMIQHLQNTNEILLQLDHSR